MDHLNSRSHPLCDERYLLNANLVDAVRCADVCGSNIHGPTARNFAESSHSYGVSFSYSWLAHSTRWRGLPDLVASMADHRTRSSRGSLEDPGYPSSASVCRAHS